MAEIISKLKLVILAAAGWLLSGCVEESTVIKVNRDGSGIIHERKYSAADLGFPFSDRSSADDEDEEGADAEEPELPTEKALRDYAATLGTGVEFSSIKPSTNKKGWKGYEIIYEFDDINTVRYARNTPKPEADDKDEEREKEEKDKRQDDFLTSFSMEDGKLSIWTTSKKFEEAPLPDAPDPDSPTIDPFADTGVPAPPDGSPASAFDEAMVKTMTKGMRMGLFLQVEGDIVATNAAHNNGKLITLYSIDFGRLLENEGGMAQLQKLDPTNRAQLEEVAAQLDGLEVDLQEPIVVEIR